jgi:hypothetical protein
MKILGKLRSCSNGNTKEEDTCNKIDTVETMIKKCYSNDICKKNKCIMLESASGIINITPIEGLLTENCNLSRTNGVWSTNLLYQTRGGPVMCSWEYTKQEDAKKQLLTLIEFIDKIKNDN